MGTVQGIKTNKGATMTKNLLTILACTLSVFIYDNARAQNVDSLLATPYFYSSSNINSLSGVTVDTAFTPSGSTWALTFPETTVHNKIIEYTHPTNPDKSYRFGIGKGGQVYSIRGAFGEAVAPQYRSPGGPAVNYGGGGSWAPWMDEVWQGTGVSSANMNLPLEHYHIHQAGVYLQLPSLTSPYYSPIVSEHYDSITKSYSIVSWGQQAHAHEAPAFQFEPGILYYNTYTSLGDGVIQVDMTMYNFGDVYLNIVGAPFGGVRRSSLEHFFRSNPNDTYALNDATFPNTGQTTIPLSTTNGWFAWSSLLDGTGPSMAIVAAPATSFTSATVFQGDIYGNPTYALARDLQFFSVNRTPSVSQFSSGMAVHFRYFFVFGENMEAVKSTIVQSGLVSEALEQAYTPAKTLIDSAQFNFYQNGIQVDHQITNNNDGLELSLQPFVSSHPLFKLTSSSGEQKVTNQTHYFSSAPHDGALAKMELLGFLDNKTVLNVKLDTVCFGADYVFEDGTTESNIQSNTSHNSYYSAAAPLEDSIVITNIYVLPEIDNSVTALGVQPLLTANATSNVSYQWLDCSNNFSEILGETTGSFTTGNQGDFAVQLTDAFGCVDTSMCVPLNSDLSINSIAAQDLKVYPNPTSGNVFIEIDDETVKSTQIIVFDILGAKVFNTSIQVKGNVVQLSLKHLSAGRYTITINDSPHYAIELID
jgi:hypothetical protein